MSEDVLAPAPRRLGRLALAGVVALAIGALVLALTTDGAALRVVGGGLFVFVVGASVSKLLRLGSGDRVEAVALAFGLGLAAIVVGGLLLDLVGALDAAGWAGFGALIVGLALLTWSRRGRRAARETAVVPAGAVDGERPERLTSSWLWVGVAGVVCVAAVSVALAISVRSAHDQTGAGFTALAFDVPTEGQPNVGVVVENRERIASTYRLDARAGDQQLLAVDGIALAADESGRFEVPVGGLASGTTVDVVLYRDGGTEVYRRISMTLP
jgi:hypothetical protein